MACRQLFDLKTFDRKLKELGSAYKGTKNWDKLGVCISQMRNLPVSLYLGNIYDGNVDVVVPKKREHLSAISCFFFSGHFGSEIRKLEQKLISTHGTILKVPFDLAHWQKVAAEKYPHGLPKPFSSDPTQWLFNGHPAGADQPLHVAVARLARLPVAAPDRFQFSRLPGAWTRMVWKPWRMTMASSACRPFAAKPAAADRLRELLAAAFGDEWSSGQRTGAAAGNSRGQ